jgi:hypothetical protein
MEKIIKEEYECETYYYSDTTTTRTLDKKNNVVHLCATYARYFMCIIDTNTFQEEYFELTPEEFIAKEYELMGDTIYRISDIEFKDVQGFRDKLDAFKILFKSEKYNVSCRMYFWFNENGVFARGDDTCNVMTGYFKISDNLNKFSIEKIFKRLKKHYPWHNFKYTINFLKLR